MNPFREFRNEIRRVILDYEGKAKAVDNVAPAETKPGEMKPAESTAAASENSAEVPH